MKMSGEMHEFSACFSLWIEMLVEAFSVLKAAFTKSYTIPGA